MAASAASSTQDKDPDSGLESTASVSSLSSSVNEQVMQPDAKRRKTIFYDDFTDGVLKFKNGETLKVSKAVLSLKSEVLYGMFKESTPPDHVIQIENCSLEDFKTFLNCVLGLEECTFDKAITLLPIACKYETSEFVSQCVKILTPEEKDIKVCRALNLATSCKCAELEDAIIKFLVDTRYIYFLLSKNGNLYLDLEPESMLKLLEEVNIDSYILEVIFNWGRSYLKRTNKRTNLKRFLEVTKISDYIRVFSFETAQALVDFDESKLGAGYFTKNDINTFIKVNGESCYGRRVSWFDIKAGDVLVEKVLIKDVVFLSDQLLEVGVYEHPVVFYECSKRLDERLFKYVYTSEILKTKKVQENGYFGTMITEALGRSTLKVSTNMNMVSDLEIEVKRTFFVDCRVLKSSAKDFEGKNPDDLYLTRLIETKYVEKPTKACK